MIYLDRQHRLADQANLSVQADLLDPAVLVDIFDMVDVLVVMVIVFRHDLVVLDYPV